MNELKICGSFRSTFPVMVRRNPSEKPVAAFFDTATAEEYIALRKESAAQVQLLERILFWFNRWASWWVAAPFPAQLRADIEAVLAARRTREES